MSETTAPNAKLLYSVTALSWVPDGTHRVILRIQGKTSTPGWTEFSLVPSIAHPSSPTDLEFDAFGVPPTGIVPDVITDIQFNHVLPAGQYNVTVYSKTDFAKTGVDYKIGDPL